MGDREGVLVSIGALRCDASGYASSQRASLSQKIRVSRSVLISNWLFDDPPNVAVITTRHVLEGEIILYVSHDEDDGAWQFHTGKPVSEADAKTVALKRIVELDPSVMQLADVPLGWIATRSDVRAVWQRRKRNENS